MYQKPQSYDVRFLRYGVRQTEFFVILDRFLPFYPTPPPFGLGKSIFWKNRKNICKYYNLTNVYHKWQLYDVWSMRWEAQWTEFFVILDHFLRFYPPNNPKNLNFEKLKKTLGDIFLLHKCTKNHDHVVYYSLYSRVPLSRTLKGPSKKLKISQFSR